MKRVGKFNLVCVCVLRGSEEREITCHSNKVEIKLMMNYLIFCLRINLRLIYLFISIRSTSPINFKQINVI